MSTPQDVRSIIGDVLQGTLDKERLTEILEEALTSKGYKRVHCKKCGNWTDAPVPDPVKIAKAIEILTNQAKGTPRQSVQKDDTPSVLIDVKNMTDEQLAQLAAG